jgi:predicted GH43/DUF377 family glycosyl hydrolase
MLPLIAPNNSVILSLPARSFNPAIALFGERRIVAWRHGNRPGSVVVTEADSDWQPIRTSAPRLALRGNRCHGSFEDPRIFRFKDRLWLAFTWVRHRRGRQAIAPLDANLTISRCFVFNSTERVEKNWQFFDHAGILHVVYRPFPHVIGRILGGQMRIADTTSGHLCWNYGEPRGGTPPVRIGNEYFSLFHSSIRRQYVGALYAFSANPPHLITRWPTQPCIMAANDSWRGTQVKVVFPSGAIYADGAWTLAYGWHDTHCCIATFKHETLLNSLKPATPHVPTSDLEVLRRSLPRFVVVLTVAEEAVEQVEWCLTHLRAAHPESELLVITDGRASSDLGDLIRRFSGRYVPGDHLRSLQSGALWWERFFYEALKHPVDYILKVDPDTRFWRRLSSIPQADFFGTVRGEGSENEHVQAGCMGFSRCFAERVLKCGVARDPVYRSRQTWTLGKRSEAWIQAKGDSYLSLDCTVLHFAKMLGVTWQNWTEVQSCSRATPQNPELKYAVTHPHKRQRLYSQGTAFAIEAFSIDADGNPANRSVVEDVGLDGDSIRFLNPNSV